MHDAHRGFGHIRKEAARAALRQALSDGLHRAALDPNSHEFMLLAVVGAIAIVAIIVWVI